MFTRRPLVFPLKKQRELQLPDSPTPILREVSLKLIHHLNLPMMPWRLNLHQHGRAISIGENHSLWEIATSAVYERWLKISSTDDNTERRGIGKVSNSAVQIPSGFSSPCAGGFVAKYCTSHPQGNFKPLNKSVWTDFDSTQKCHLAMNCTKKNWLRPDSFSFFYVGFIGYDDTVFTKRFEAQPNNKTQCSFHVRFLNNVDTSLKTELLIFIGRTAEPCKSLNSRKQAFCHKLK